LKKKQELNELKAELETAKLNIREAEEEKAHHMQRFKNLTLSLQSLKKTFFSTEKEIIKV
jgi:predicted  nucleic acid-binding Zn-ribbon protein